MTNTKLLKEKIDQSGLKITFIAKKINKSRATLSKKINDKVSFTQYEIEVLCEILKITSLEEKNAIFFAKNVN